MPTYLPKRRRDFTDDETRRLAAIHVELLVLAGRLDGQELYKLHAERLRILYGEPEKAAA